jgi:hypothetical protein
MIVLMALGVYLVAGVAVAAGFVVFGVTRVLPEHLPVTVGARILLFPGAAVLWPYVLARWLKSSRGVGIDRFTGRCGPSSLWRSGWAS